MIVIFSETMSLRNGDLLPPIRNVSSFSKVKREISDNMMMSDYRLSIQSGVFFVKVSPRVPVRTYDFRDFVRQFQFSVERPGVEVNLCRSVTVGPQWTYYTIDGIRLRQ